MAPAFWKLTTLASTLAAVLLAVHPIRGTQPAAARSSVAAADRATTAGQRSSPFGWFVGSASADESTDGTAARVARLRQAKTVRDRCDAMDAIGDARDDAATDAVAEFAQPENPPHVRGCAATALGKLRTGASRSWLGELVGDRAQSVRHVAIQALAARVDDPEARAMLVDVAKRGEPDARRTALLSLASASAREATPLLLAALQDPDGDDRQAFVRALGRTKDPAAVDALVKIAADPGDAQRTNALEALGQIGGDRAIAALRETLTSGTASEVRAASIALAQTGEPAARAALIETVKSARGDSAHAALDALTQAEAEGDDVRALMLSEIDSRDPKMAASAARYFSAHQDESAVPQLIALARRGSRDGGPEAVMALASIDSDASRAALSELAMRDRQTGALRRLSMMPGGRDDARRVALSLLREGGPNAEAAVEVLASDNSPEARAALLDVARSGQGQARSAMYLLARRGDAEAVRALTDLAQRGDADSKREALAALASTESREAVGVLTRALKDGDLTIKQVALDGLAQLGAPDAIRSIVEASSSSDSETRRAAASALLRSSAPDGVAALEKLAHDADSSVAQAGLYGLAMNAPEKAAMLAADQMKSADPEVRRAAVQTGTMLDPDAARGVLLTGLRDSDLAVATLSAHTLARVGGAEVPQALAALLLREDAPMASRQAAAEALHEMGGDTAKRYADLIAKLTADSYDTGVVSVE